MSSGTRVTISRYYNGKHYMNTEEIDEKIIKFKNQVEETWGEILALCAATPKDIVPQCEDIPLAYVKKHLNELRSYLDYLDYELSALYDIKEGWETKEED